MRTIVTIDGIDGSGKSIFAQRLVGALSEAGLAAVVVRIDDFRCPLDWAAPDRTEAELYYDDYYDLALCERCLGAFKMGARGFTIPAFDVLTERITGTRALDFTDATVAVVEGVFPLRVGAVGDGLLVYLRASEAEARRRIIARDRLKGRTTAEIERRIDQRYFPSQRRYHAELAPEQRADVVIDNEQPATPRVLARVLDRASEPLRAILDRLLPR